MNGIIKIDSDNRVSGRELHDFLEVGRDFTNWMKQMIGYGFSEHADYEVYAKNGENPTGGRPSVDYTMTIDMAKEICMIQRTEKGKQARQYFIECERRLKAASIPQDSYMIADPVERAKKWIEEETVREQQAVQLEAQRPKVLFADSVSVSQTAILIGELAKIIKQNGVDMGQNRLFTWMRDHKYLISRKGTDYNMPTQKAMKLGLFVIKETTVNHSDGHTSVSKTPKVTGKGQIYFINKFLSEADEAVGA